MKDKTKEKLIQELMEMRQPLAESEALETERMHAEEELSLVYDALNSAVSGVIVTNLQGRIRYVNPAFLRIFEYKDKTEVLGKNAADLFATEEVKKFADVKAIIDKTRGETEEFTARHEDGRTFPVEVSSSNVTDSEGNIVGRMASFIDITPRKQAEKEVRYLSRRLMDTAEQERKRLARDLHDECGQILSALHLGMEALQRSIPDELEDQRMKCDELIGLVQQLGETIRNISHELRPGMLDDLGLIPTLEWYLKDFADRSQQIQTEFQALGFQRRLDPETEIVLYRIVQEGLNNVARHARAKRVSVSLTCSHPNVILTLRDDGVGFEAKRDVSASDTTKRGIGLLGMRERVASVGGSIHIRSAKGKGTVVRAELPISKRGTDA